MKSELNENNLKRLIKNSKCQILATSNGVMVNGRDVEILTLLSAIIDTIKTKTNISNEMIKVAIMLGIDCKETYNKDDELVDVLLKELKEYLDL